MADAGSVQIDVFDMAGRIVDTIFAGDVSEGTHSIAWDGADAGGRPLADGIYMIRLQGAAGASSTRTCVLLR